MTLRALPNQTAGTGSAKTNLLGLLCLTIAEARPSETNWPGWRGPRGDGSSMDPNVPVKWTMTDDEVMESMTDHLGRVMSIEKWVKLRKTVAEIYKERENTAW